MPNHNPNVHFIWVGPLKESSFTGPLSLAQATNSKGEKYPLTYWVEPENLK